MASIDERLTYLENNIPVAESYDTGWVSKTGFQNQDLNVVHNLNANLPELIVKIFLSNDGTDANAREVSDITYAPGGSQSYGMTIYQDSVNQIHIQTGATAILYNNDANGTSTGVSTGTFYYRVVVYKPNSISVLRASLQSVGSYKYSTGWIENSSWQNAELNVTHNLGTDLSGLLLRMFVSSDGTEANALTITDGSASGTVSTGLSYYQISTNQIKVQTHSSGIYAVADNGTLLGLTTNSYYYKIVVYKPDVISVCTTPSTSSSGVYNYPPVFQIEDRKTPSSTNGGTLTSGSWYTRELNTIARNEIVGSSLSNDQFTLPPGKYEFDIEAPCYNTNYTVARLYNVTDSTVDLWSPNTLAHGAYSDYSSNIIKDVLTITETKTFKIEQYCTRTEASYGRGIAYDSGPAASLDYAIYTKVIVRQLEKF